MQDVLYHLCPKCFFIFRCEHKDATECPCGHPRYRDEQKKMPWATLLYRPIRFWIERLFGTEALAKLMSWHAENDLGGPDVMVDIYDGTVYKSAMQEAPFKDDHRHVLLNLAFDGFLPFEGDDRYSCWPFVVTPVNLPPWVRYALGVTTLVAVVPGTRDLEAKPNLASIKKLLCDELKWLRHHGWEVKDASRNNEVFLCHAKLLHTVSDSR